MPKKYSSSIIISLLSRLFVFIGFSLLCFYYHLLCFIVGNTSVLPWYSLGNTIFHQKSVNIFLNFRNTAFKMVHIYLCCEQFLKFSSKQSKYGLLKLDYSAKQSEQCLNVSSDYPNNRKSLKKQSQAFKIYTTRLLLPTFQLRYCSFLDPNPTL